ncbi:MAG: GPR endopeptidase [Xylanivirga thermophila]|jgi:spore protease|uniref:GPR endopeptidase n=1 Tax=Xylanivirga thermophila TaxID=2496273 RepID=UPI00101D3FF4|nr:GPR endopeptidase [Xylanivirga thermophila]
MSNIRTDLAIEARELYAKDHEEIPGVETEDEESDNIRINRVRITSPLGERQLNKPMGNYITIDAVDIRERDPEYGEMLSRRIGDEIRKIVNLNDHSTTLVVGLGNWNITADSLGPKVVDRMMVTRHIIQLMPDQVDERVRPVCAIAPGVLGITGIETGEIIKGIVDRIKPDCVIAIDALASRSTNRIGTTIQIADTGINPGSGIGNHRMGLSKETLGATTIAIGVPTVVYAHTIGRDSLQLLIDKLSARTTPGTPLYGMIKELGEDKMDNIVEEILTNNMGDLVVTPKDIDVMMEHISGIIADGINLALHKDVTLEEVHTFLQ